MLVISSIVPHRNMFVVDLQAPSRFGVSSVPAAGISLQSLLLLVKSRTFLITCGLLQVITGIVIEPLYQRLKFFGFLLYSWGGFSIMHIRCSVKYV
jgi:hypothetical protein